MSDEETTKPEPVEIPVETPVEAPVEPTVTEPEATA